MKRLADIPITDANALPYALRGAIYDIADQRIPGHSDVTVTERMSGTDTVARARRVYNAARSSGARPAEAAIAAATDLAAHYRDQYGI